MSIVSHSGVFTSALKGNSIHVTVWLCGYEVITSLTR